MSVPPHHGPKNILLRGVNIDRVSANLLVGSQRLPLEACTCFPELDLLAWMITHPVGAKITQIIPALDTASLKGLTHSLLITLPFQRG